MDLYEFQARDMFAAYGIPVLEAGVARTAEDARAVARGLGGRAVVKAQVKTGGRGKAGGVRVAAHPAEVAEHASHILGMSIRGHRVCTVMVAEAAAIAEEYYLALLLDRSTGDYLLMASREGGVDIEQLARTAPEALLRVPVDPLEGLGADDACQAVDTAGFPEEVRPAVADILLKMWDLLVAEEATLVEINPVARLEDGRVVALDAKLTLDDNSRFRHPEHERLVDSCEVDPLEVRARARGLNYVKLDGQIGVIGNGAGLVMSTLDVVARAGDRHGGIRPANFLDIGGGASAEVMANALEIILEDPQVEAVLVNVFGGITACDLVAHGIVNAFRLLEQRGTPVTRPLVVRLDGNNADLGQEIIDDFASTLPSDQIQRVGSMDDAARRVVEIVAGAHSPAGVGHGEGWVI